MTDEIFALDQMKHTFAKHVFRSRYAHLLNFNKKMNRVTLSIVARNRETLNWSF